MPILQLEDGVIFKGYWISAPNEAVGDVVVHAGMTGYQEILTDPASCGQIVVMSYPLIGNYGVQPFTSESARIHARGMLVQEACDTPSHWQARGSFGAYLNQEGCAGLYGLDTRAVVRHIRKNGVMRGIVTDQPGETAREKIAAFSMKGAVSQVTAEKSYEISGNGWDVAVLDCGLRRSVIDALVRRGCRVRVFPARTPAAEILRLDPDGIVVAGGPGDPADDPAVVRAVEAFLGALPIMGIGMGLDALALAGGGSVVRMHFGHRGSSIPILDKRTGRGLISSQNHGYVVDRPPPGAEVSYVNGQDGSIEGIRMPNRMAFGVAFDPPARLDPRDTVDLYREFFEDLDRFRLTAR